MSVEEKVRCLTPTPGKKPTRILKWKYDLVRDAILAVIPAEGIEFNRLSRLVEGQQLAEELQRLGSVSWYNTTAKLDMEVKGRIERVSRSKPQLLRKNRRTGGLKVLAQPNLLSVAQTSQVPEVCEVMYLKCIKTPQTKSSHIYCFPKTIL